MLQNMDISILKNSKKVFLWEEQSQTAIYFPRTIMGSLLFRLFLTFSHAFCFNIRMNFKRVLHFWQKKEHRILA